MRSRCKKCFQRHICFEKRNRSHPYCWDWNCMVLRHPVQIQKYRKWAKWQAMARNLVARHDWRAFHCLDANGRPTQLQKTVGQNRERFECRQLHSGYHEWIRGFAIPGVKVLRTVNNERTWRKELLLSRLLHRGRNSMHALRFHFLHCLHEKA